MQGIYGIKMVVTCKTKEVLKKVKKNREEHAQIVKEARKGYLEKAQAALRERLQELEAGKLKALSFRLKVPSDHTAEYDTVIQMLEMHQPETIDLNADEVRHLIEDKWDWTDEFLTSNALYSKTAACKIRD